MRTYNLTVVALVDDLNDAELFDRLFEAGCADATISIQKGLVVLEFDREAMTFGGALLSALRDVERAGAAIERVEPDHLVNAGDIARRTGLGRAAISLYANGSRREGFPHPVARVTTDSPLWDWVEVSSWMYQTRRLGLKDVVAAKMVRDVNRAAAGVHEPTSWFARQLLRRTEGHAA